LADQAAAFGFLDGSGEIAGMTYRFGQYELDESRRELQKEGQRVDVEPKAFELLVYLLNNRDRAVSKDDLLNELWPRSIVTETALSRCVMKARRAVGDDSDQQSVIRTLHGHGYRFIADLEVSAQTAENDPPAEAEQNVARAQSRLRLYGLAAVLLVALGAGYIATRKAPAPEPAGMLAVLPINNRVATEDMDWVRNGLMSLMQRMLEDDGVEVVSERSVIRAVDDATLASPPDDNLLEQIRLRSGAENVLHTTLDLQAGLYRLSIVITHLDGRKTRRVIVGESATSVAADMAQVIAEIMVRDVVAPGRRFSKVSTDPFINEVYARALDMELRGQPREARDLFGIAANQEPELFWLRYEIALCTRDLREWDEASAMFTALYDEAYSGADAEALIATLNSHGVMKFSQNDYDASERLLLQALNAATERGFASNRAAIHVNLALIANRRGEVLKAKQQYELALRAFDESGEEPGPSFNNNYAGLLMGMGDLSTAQVYSERAVEEFRIRGERRFEAPSLNRLAKIHRRRGDVEGAISRHEQALSIYRDIGNTSGELGVMLAMTVVYRENGDLTRARLSTQEVIERASRIDNQLLIADAYMQAALIEQEFDKLDTAIIDFEFARSIFVDVGDDSGLRAADQGIALASLELGHIQRAQDIADTLLQSARKIENSGSEARAIWLQGKIADHINDQETATAQYTEVINYARSNSDQSLLIRAAASLAQIYLSAGDTEIAAQFIEEIRPIAQSQHDFMRLDARFAYASGAKAKGLTIMSELRARAGEAWSEEDTTFFELLEQL